MFFEISKPINDTQREFNVLCKLGGGVRGGPARTRVQVLLRDSGKSLNELAYTEIERMLTDLPDRNPWHVCFAVGLSWGHLARLEIDFVDAATRALKELYDSDLKVASSFHYERGPEPIEQSLRGGHVLFERVRLPESLPTTLGALRKCEDAWMRPIANPTTRPKYIGNWNATAMFMVALFANPALARTLTTNEVLLPPGGPISAALALLQKSGLVRHPPAAKFDEGEIELGAIAEDNGLFVEVHAGLSDWSLLDVHSGLYMLGTRYPQSDNWF